MMASDVIPLRTKPQKATSTRTDTISFTVDDIDKWKRPEFQREVKHTSRFKDCAELIKENDGVIPGIVTLGVENGTNDIYKVDGNHRTEAAKSTGLRNFYADVRYIYGTMEDFAEEYSRLNEQISTTKPDDRLRAAAVINPRINRLLALCKVVGFKATRKPKLKISMSSALRAWGNACKGTPATRGRAAAATDIIKNMSDGDFGHFENLLGHCERAWGRDEEYANLWGQMNLTMVMWLYCRLVVEDPRSAKLKRLTPGLFESCLMELTVDTNYSSWLRGRNGGDHRTPCYNRVKERFAKRIREETGTKPNLPQPDWAS
jgi:hypothetical protein